MTNSSELASPLLTSHQFQVNYIPVDSSSLSYYNVTMIYPLKAGFHLNECNDSAEAARVGAFVVGSNVDSPAADLGRIG